MPPIGPSRVRPSRPRPGRTAVAIGAAAVALAGCSVFATPQPSPVHDASLAPPGLVGYVACPNAVTPVELSSRVAEPPIHLPVTGSPTPGDFAITTSPDGKWAYVVTSSGTPAPTGAAGTSSTGTSSTGASTTAAPGAHGSGAGVHDVVIPIDLQRQQALAPIVLPGSGPTHAVALMANGRTILAASGTTVVPVDAITRDVGTPLDLGPGRTVYGMAFEPRSPILFALVPGAVVPVDTADATAGAAIPTGLAVSSVASPHGIVVTGDGATIYVAGQGGSDFGGRVVALATATGAQEGTTGFDRFGISDPAALALTTEGSSLQVVDSANDWVVPVPLATFDSPGTPVRLPQRTGGTSGQGTGHPTDIVAVPGRYGVFVVDGLDAVLPYSPVSATFGRPVTVCTGASSMTVAPAP